MLRIGSFFSICIGILIGLFVSGIAIDISHAEDPVPRNSSDPVTPSNKAASTVTIISTPTFSNLKSDDNGNDEQQKIGNHLIISNNNNSPTCLSKGISSNSINSKSKMSLDCSSSQSIVEGSASGEEEEEGVESLGGEKEASFSVPKDDLIFCDVSVVLPTDPCVGTDGDDIIYTRAVTNEVYALDGNDMIFDSAGDDRLYGGKDDDLIAAGGGNDLVDGGPNDDVLLAGGDNDLLVGGRGNDKLFGGSGTTVMYGGRGANHFDCPLSALGLAKSVVMDYNPTKGDIISGPCKTVNTLANGDSSGNKPPVTLPDTGEEGGSSSGTTDTITEIIPGTQIR